MKLLFDFLPLLLFFLAYKFKDIYFATGVAIAASVAQIGWSYFRKKKIEGMQWTSLVIIAVFGGATLLFRNPTFIKWKPTVLYWCFATALLAGDLLFGKNLIQVMLKQQIELPDRVWRGVNLSWGLFFGAMGGLNLYVAFHYPEATWVNFKAFGTTLLMLAFSLVQGVVMSRYVEEKDGPPPS